MEENKNKIINIADYLENEIWVIASEIGNNPEEGYKEFFAHKVLTNFLRKKGFNIENSLAGIETAFSASFRGKDIGPKIAFLAEYDALPEIGHGCGHNLIGAASVGAAVVLSSIGFSGEVIVIGTPAEESSGAKVVLVEQDVFKDMNAVLMFHPGSCYVPEISSLALDALEITYYGKAGHMAISENNGINALDALLILFEKLSKFKRRLSKSERIDGIIIEGGKVPNVVPDKTVARFYLRAGTRDDLDKLRHKFLDLASKAASIVGAQMSWKYYENSYHEMKSNSVLAGRFRDNLQELGIREIEPPQTMMGSVDLGNVSQVVPAIHPYLKLGKGLEVPHTIEFTQAVLSDEGKKVLSLAVKALALTGWDILTDKILLEKMQKEFKKERHWLGRL
ncbi:MAG: amidohydrolase [Gracilibacter sp. BRH_c7a]|nr:MAG: amidohydrolase [Gracilibacter sp. BRH_c7a]